MRLFAWWKDPVMARTTAELIKAHASGASWESAAPLLLAYADGKLDQALAGMKQMIPHMTSQRVVARHRALMFQIIAEFMAASDRESDVLDAIEGASRVTTFIHLAWLDHCPSLAIVRDEARFAAARAVVAERVAQILD
jgi:hypothetical protein